MDDVALFSQAIDNFAQGDYEQAKQWVQGLSRKGRYRSDALNLLSGIAVFQNDLEGAIECLDQAKSLGLDKKEFTKNLVVIYRELGNDVEALKLAQKLTDAYPVDAESWNLLARIYTNLDEYQLAFMADKQAIKLSPEDKEYLFSLIQSGLKVVKTRKEIILFIQSLKTISYDQALIDYNQAISLDFNYKDAFATHYAEQIEAGKSHAYAYYYAREKSKDKSDEWAAAYAEKDAYFSRGFFNLKQGLFEKAWIDLQVNCEPKSMLTDEKLWKNQDLKGKRLMIYSEEAQENCLKLSGMGDILMFLHLVPELKAEGAYIILYLPKELMNITLNLPWVDEQFAQIYQAVPTDYDYHISLVELLSVRVKKMEDIPQKVPYLVANDKLVIKYKPCIRIAQALQVGVVWAGSRSNPNDHNRSIPVQHFLQLQKAVNLKFYSLQQGERYCEHNGEMVSLGLRSVDDYSNTAAMMHHLDLIISCCTSAAHLAGALGKAVWILLPYSADWRWFIDREDCPWYPSARLYRQKQAGNWDEVFLRLVGLLSDKIELLVPKGTSFQA